MSSVLETVEHVLVVPTLLFHEIGHFQGFNSQTDIYLRTLLDPAHTSYRPRPAMEADPSFKQLIPYCIFCCGDMVFHYARGKAQGEGRLHLKRSIGVGGHISTLDADKANSAYEEGLRRELDEEISIDSPYQQHLAGLINDDLTEVGKVHLGIVHIFQLEAPKVLPREQSMINAGFAPLAELHAQRDQFETWSQICLDFLKSGK